MVVNNEITIDKKEKRYHSTPNKELLGADQLHNYTRSSNANYYRKCIEYQNIFHKRTWKCLCDKTNFDFCMCMTSIVRFDVKFQTTTRFIRSCAFMGRHNGVTYVRIMNAQVFFGQVVHFKLVSI